MGVEPYSAYYTELFGMRRPPEEKFKKVGKYRRKFVEIYNI
jgi:hypothetical protein